uniref:Uncharacterized protein n=1 Tax=Anguilla anguilla TaxID=7936 RepID=A0A0E9REX6_ANGAN
MSHQSENITTIPQCPPPSSPAVLLQLTLHYSKE